MSAMSPSSLAWVGATVALYLASRWLMVRLRGHPLANTVLLPAAIIVISFVVGGLIVSVMTALLSVSQVIG